MASLDALRMLGYLTADDDEYGLVEGLHVTKAKARPLLYHSALRQMDGEPEVDELLRGVIGKCVLCKDGDMFLFEVSQPLTMDRLRQRIRKFGFISDGTLSDSLARISGDALVALVEALMPTSDAQRKPMLKKLRDGGYEGKDMASIIKRVAISAASSVSGKVVGKVAEEAVNALWPFLSGKIEQLKT